MGRRLIGSDFGCGSRGCQAVSQCVTEFCRRLITIVLFILQSLAQHVLQRLRNVIESNDLGTLAGHHLIQRGRQAPQITTRVGLGGIPTLFSVTVADAITIVGDAGDGQIGSDGSIAGISVQKDRTGTGGDNDRGLALIYFFELPTFSAFTTITNAELEFEYVEEENSPEFKIDLFGIDARPSAIFQASDYYDGNAGTMVTRDRVPIR